MTVLLVKYSTPGWEKPFSTIADAVGELRKHICETCLIGPSIYVDANGQPVEADWEEPVVDTISAGVRYECRDAGTLLGTPCGCEFGIEDEDEE